MLTVSQFASAVNVSEQTVRVWLKNKHIRGIRVGKRGHWRIEESQLERVLGKPKPKYNPNWSDEFRKVLDTMSD